VRRGELARTAQPTQITPDAPSAAAATTLAVPRASIAVLPFTNVSGDPSKEYFCDGMAEELIHLLSRVPGLKVPARTSAFAYKGKNVDVRQIARDLGVASVLEGSVRSAGARLRINAQLIDAQTGYHFLSQSFDRESGDIFQLQDEIAAAIVQSLMSHMKIALQQLAGRAPPTRDVEAYQLYLLALSIGVRGGDWTTHRAIELLGQAIALDPGFARALAVRAAMRIALIFYGHPDAVPQAEREARQALSLDSRLGEAHSALGMVSGVRRKWLDAEEHFQAAAGSGGTDIFVYAAYLPACVGYRRRALEVLLVEYARAPAAPLLPALLASASLGLPSSADATMRAVHYADLSLDLGGTKESGPLPIVRLYCGARLGQAKVVNEAARSLAGRLHPDLRALGGAAVLERVGVALTDPAQHGAAVSALCSLTTSDPRRFGPELSVHVIAWLTMLGELDEAYAFATRILDQALQAETMGIFLAWIWLPELLPFRRDARFTGLAQRLGLMEYWLARGPPDECELVGGRLMVHE
jgi:adenylate cyclase